MLCIVKPPGDTEQGRSEQRWVEEGSRGVHGGRDTIPFILTLNTWATPNQESTGPFVGEAGEKAAFR